MKIEVYSSKLCMYCEAAKRLLKHKGLPFKEVDVTNNRKLRDEITRKTKHRTVPQIFIDDQFIGGYTELVSHFKKAH